MAIFGLLNICLAYLAIATVLRWIWPGGGGKADFIALAVFSGWLLLNSWLGMFPTTGRRTAKKPSRVAIYLFYFVGYSVMWALFDHWRHEFRGIWSIVSAAFAGLLVAGLMEWSSRRLESPFSIESTLVPVSREETERIQDHK